MAKVTQNGPLASYYIALAASCFGWSEIALHLAFLVPAVAAVLGTYFLAARFCTEPLLAALATLLCPVFLLSSTTLMCDVMMLAFWVWAVVLWLRSAEGGTHVFAILSACLIAAACLTKYFAAVSLIPLLLAYSLLRRPRVGWRVLYLAIPVAVFLGYDLTMRSLYGQSLLYGAGSYALTTGRQGSCSFRGVVTLSFIGGCLATVIFYAPMLWSRRVLVAGILAIGLMVGLLSAAKSLGHYELPGDNATRLLVLLQFSIFVVAGVGLLALAIADLWHARDAGSTLLVLWTAGIFVFCWIFNPMVNGRTILPMVPAATILIVRGIDRHTTGAVGRPFSWKFVPLAFVGVLAAAVAWADMRWADNDRLAAGKIHDQFHLQKDTVLFAGHWGFQYYMESYGFKAVDYTCRLMPGTILIMPIFNDIIFPPLPREAFSKIVSIELVSCPYLATMRLEVGSGFYGRPGILPFAVGPVSNERYCIMTVAHACEVHPLMRQYQQELEQHPDSAELLGKVGHILINVGRGSEAKKYLERAVQLNSSDALSYNDLARLLATREPAQGGDPVRAVTLAERACKLTDNKAFACFDTLAAAYAAAGRFPEAIATAQKAIAMASAAGQTAWARQIQTRLELYQGRRAFREPTRQSVDHAP